jgi:hypothetical protein
MNLSTLSAAWRVFQAGEAVADPTKWKQHQVTANAVTVLLAALVALLKGLGYDLHMDDTTLAALGAGAFALVNWLLTVATTDKVGILGQRAAVAGKPGDAPAGEPGALAAPAGGEPADPGAPDPVRPDGDAAQAPGGYLRG